MKKFERRSGLITTKLSADEVELLTSLIRQLVELVSDGEPDDFDAQPQDAFERLVQDMQIDPDEPEVPEDPVLKRLFPPAYPHDAQAASDFRRFTERDLRSKKVADARLVLDGLIQTRNGTVKLRLADDEAGSWLRTLTAVRLALAVRLEITDAESADHLAQLPEDDPRSFMASVYDWLGFAQETLLSAL